MRSFPKITVLMPVYNCENFVEKAVQSILNQTFTDFEFIIIDDASTDKTLDIVKSFIDLRISIIEKARNSGYVNSLNHGLSIARGKYIARMDGDDISLPMRFQRQVSFMDANKDVVVCGTNFNYLNKEGVKNNPILHDDIKIRLLYKNSLGHPTVMIRKSALINHRLNYDVSKEPAEDYALWVKLLGIGNLHNLDEVLLSYRQHDNQVSIRKLSVKPKIRAEIRISILEYINYFPSLKEKKLLMKSFSRLEVPSYNDLISFENLSKLLLLKNSNNFFNTIQFNSYLNYQKKVIYKDYFTNRLRYNPVVFINYVKLKFRFEGNFEKVNSVKLFFKCLVFHKNLKSRFKDII
ncbi:MAG: glycosyltransferase [Psychroserpens sp.]|uniref:glycosyltransferase family 2 protein n=1 Tax=Psychroserpens sp. TaxID=2020870 RepID=UPI003CC2D748